MWLLCNSFIPSRLHLHPGALAITGSVGLNTEGAHGLQMRGTTDYDFYCRILSACSFIASKCQSLGKKEFHWSQRVLIGMLWIAMTFTHCILEEIPSIRSGGLNCKSCHPSEDGRTTKRFGVSCYDLQFWCSIQAASVFTPPFHLGSNANHQVRRI